SGKIGHAEMKIADRALFMLSDQYPGYNHSPEEYGGSTAVLYVYVGDVDRFIDRAVKAGAEVVMAGENQVYGDPSGPRGGPVRPRRRPVRPRLGLRDARRGRAGGRTGKADEGAEGVVGFENADARRCTQIDQL